MDNPNITMEEYIRLEEEKARRHGKVYNWETAKYGKIWYDEDVHDLRSVETEFPAIVFNDELSSEKTLSCEPTVSSLNNNEIDFRISFDESDDEDYTVIFDKNSFSYKIISVNDLKTDSENDNEKVNMPSFPSPEPKVSCFDDLDFFKDFENEFPAIVYNDALTSKSDFLTEPTLSPQHIDEFDLKDETSLYKYDEVEQNILYFSVLFPFNIIYPDNLKSDKDNEDNKIDIIQSSRGNVNTQGSKKFLEASHDKINKIFIMESFVIELDVNIMAWNYLNNGMLLNLIKNLYVPFGIPFDPKWYYKDGVYTRMLRRPRDAQGHIMFTSRAWRWLFDIRCLLVQELILEFFNTFRFGEAVTDLDTAEALQFQLGGVRRRMSWREFILALGLHTAEEMHTIGFARDFLGTAPSYTSIRDPILRLCHRLITCSIARKSQAPEKVTITDLFYLRGMDVGSVNVPYLLASYLRLLTGERLRGLTVTAPTLSVIDMAELNDVAAGVPGVTEDSPTVDEGDQAVLAPVQAPPPPPAAARTMPQRMVRLEEDLHDIRGALAE
ncbi:hypothetical protein Tco_0716111 [Tanacetum coccineum]